MENKAELYKGLAKFRAQLKQPEKDAENPYFGKPYVTLAGIMQAVDAALPGTGLSYLQIVETLENGSTGVTTSIVHESGAKLNIGPLILKPVKNDPQGVGSAITYAKRYSLAAAFGVSSDMDDDGNAATYSNGAKQQAAPKQSYKQQAQRRTAPTQDSKKAVLKAQIIKLAKRLNAEPKEVQESVINVAKQGEPNYDNLSQSEKNALLLKTATKMDKD